MTKSVMQQLHDSEINAEIQSFYDGCWTVRLGDPMNGFTRQSTSPESYEEAEEELVRLALEEYPQSEFALGQPTPPKET